MPRYSLTLSDQEVKDLKRLAQKDDRSMASMMRVVFKRGLHVSISASNPRQNDVKSASEQRHNDATPDPARAGTDSGRKKEEKKKRERVSASGVAATVIGEMNRIVKAADSSRRGWTVAAWEPSIRTLVRKGFTADDLLEVVRWRAAEVQRKNDWQWFTPDTLFKPTKFPGYLDNARAGVQYGAPSRGQSTMDFEAGCDEVPDA
jgi:uncharacterized phage protein (TIGR02220 family)